MRREKAHGLIRLGRVDNMHYELPVARIACGVLRSACP